MKGYRATNLLLTMAGCLAEQLSWAQRTAVAPLAPSVPVVQPVPSPGVLLNGRQAGVAVPRRPPETTTTATTPRAWPQPMFLLNSHIIIVNELSLINPQDIGKLYVYKSLDMPARWRSLGEHGIIDITLKAGVKLKIKSKSLAAIRRQAKVSGLVSFELDGKPIEDNSLRVAAAAIAELEVLHHDAATVVNIRLVPPKPAPPRHDPPGTIYIRGMASR